MHGNKKLFVIFASINRVFCLFNLSLVNVSIISFLVFVLVLAFSQMLAPMPICSPGTTHSLRPTCKDTLRRKACRCKGRIGHGMESN